LAAANRHVLVETEIKTRGDMQDEEINETIARRLFGMVRPDEDGGQVVYIGEWPNYCGDIAVAWPILDRLFELGWWRQSGCCWGACLGNQSCRSGSLENTAAGIATITGSEYGDDQRD
jgi:hypothetical protein